MGNICFASSRGLPQLTLQAESPTKAVDRVALVTNLFKQTYGETGSVD